MATNKIEETYQLPIHKLVRGIRLWQKRDAVHVRDLYVNGATVAILMNLVAASAEDSPTKSVLVAELDILTVQQRSHQGQLLANESPYKAE